MNSVLGRITRSLSQRGLVGTAQMCWVCISPGARQREARRQQIDDEFDTKYGVDTGGTLRPAQDEVIGENWSLSGHYAAVEPDAFTEALSKVSLSHSEFTFIDFGSGKGRSLLLASHVPFKEIIGVEFCPELNRIARENVVRYPASLRRCKDIKILGADATTFPIPEGPLVLFLNNPFAGPVMAEVVKNVAESFRRCPRRIVVIYFWPFQAGVWEAAGFLKRIQTSPAIFDTANA